MVWDLDKDKRDWLNVPRLPADHPIYQKGALLVFVKQLKQPTPPSSETTPAPPHSPPEQ